MNEQRKGSSPGKFLGDSPSPRLTYCSCIPAGAAPKEMHAKVSKDEGKNGRAREARMQRTRKQGKENKQTERINIRSKGSRKNREVKQARAKERRKHVKLDPNDSK